MKNLTESDIVVEGEVVASELGPIDSPFIAFTEAQLIEWNNVIRTNQRYIDPTPILLEMELVEDKLAVTEEVYKREELINRMSDLQDKLTEAYDR